MKSRIILAAILCLVPIQALADEPTSETGKLQFTFIGNEAFRITDGKNTLMTDFPYRSGASGSMRYDIDKVTWNGEVICLVTHGHADHFDVVAYRKYGFTMIAPPGVAQRLAGPDGRIGYDVKLAVEPISYRGIDVIPYETPHTGTDHRSYEVTWHGVRMFFCGDTEYPSELLAATDLDVAFVPPWLLEAIQESGDTIDADRIVIYHHKAGERFGAFINDVQPKPIIPKQGETFEIEFTQ